MSKTTSVNKSFNLEVGSRLGNEHAPCVWLLRPNGVEYARAERCLSSGKLLFQFNGGMRLTEAEFGHTFEGLASLYAAAQLLPAYGGKVAK